MIKYLPLLDRFSFDHQAMFANLLVSPLFSLWLVLLPCKDAGEAAAQEGFFAFCQSFIHLSLSQSTSVLDMGAQGERMCICVLAFPFQESNWEDM